jgi:transcriptional regulator with XRE-family HTH domain
MSQMALAHAANSTPRYLSFLETGRAHPTAGMVIRLCDVLRVPPSERNPLLIAAGYAPRYRETGLDRPEMGRVRHALRSLLRHLEPCPAAVTDRYLNLLITNQAIERFSAQFFDPQKLWPHGHPNGMDSWLSPLGYRPFIANWDRFARWVLAQGYRRSLTAASDPIGRAFFEGWLRLPGVREAWRPPQSGEIVLPIAELELVREGISLETQLVITTFGSPQDALLKEMRITVILPANRMARKYFSWLRATRGRRGLASFRRSL